DRSVSYFADDRRQFVPALPRPATLFLDQSDRNEGNLDSLSTAARSRRKGRRLAKLPTDLSAQIILDVGNHNRGRAWFVRYRRAFAAIDDRSRRHHRRECSHALVDHDR